MPAEFVLLAFAIIASALLLLLAATQVEDVLLTVNGVTCMAIEIPLGQPATIAFEAMNALGDVVAVPDSVAVTFSAEPVEAGEFGGTTPLATTFTPSLPGNVILRGRADIDGQEWIATQVVEVKAGVASVRLRVNGAVE